MRRALIDMRPDRFEDIIALVALYRPGPMANIPTYCARKHGTERPDYIHPKLEPILRETYGVIIYQEQVMQIAQRCWPATVSARRTSCAAPWARKIRRRWRRSAPISSPARSSGASGGPGGCDFRTAGALRRIRLQQEPRGAYALVTYQTAYMKANYPVEFLAASMTLDMGNTDKLTRIPYGGASASASRSSRPRSTARASISRSREHHPLRAGGGAKASAGRRSRRSSRRAGPAIR